MTEEQRIKIIRALQAKGATKPCPRCGSENFEIAGATPVPLNEEFTQIKFNVHVLPSVIVGCTNCGHMFLHSLHHLGFTNGLP